LSDTTQERSDSIAAKIAIVNASGIKPITFSILNEGNDIFGIPELIVYKSPIVNTFNPNAPTTTAPSTTTTSEAGIFLKGLIFGKTKRSTKEAKPTINPTGLKVEVTLDRGKGRDKRDIEKLYLHGLNRIYSQMGDRKEELYKAAPEYKGTGESQLTTSADNKINLKDVVEVEDFHKVNESLVKHFGTGYVKSILLASGEISYGSQKKKEPEKTT
jgi:hypothetical protein